MKVTEKCASQGEQTLIICDFSPPRSADPATLEPAKSLGADFICVAYSPGRSVRADSAMMASAISQRFGKEVIFNLATRDMNRLAVQNHLLGAEMLGLKNVVVLKGDDFGDKDLSRVKHVGDFTPTGLIQALERMNEGLDFRGRKLSSPSDLCIGATIDLSRPLGSEAELTHRKVSAGAHFFLTQPVFGTDEVASFLDAYRAASGEDLSQPVFFGVQVLVKDGVIFSTVPQRIRTDLEGGREGTDIALQLLQDFSALGIKRIYLVPPILKGGARDYQAAQRVIDGVRRG